MLTQTNLSALVGLHGPNAIVFTPDKNRTWAAAMGLPALEGHKKGGDTARTIIRECFNLGIRDVVIWAMSDSNVQKRPEHERLGLIALLKQELQRQEQEGEEYGFRMCGRFVNFRDEELNTLVARAHARTAKFQKHRLTVLLYYRGITDWKQAASRVAEKMGPEAIENEDLLRQYMWIKHLPPRVDMMVRTGVDPRRRHNSDSLMPMHGEQAFIHDVQKPWPAFTVEDLHQGILDYAECHRPQGA